MANVRVISAGVAQVRVIPLERNLRVISAGYAQVRVIPLERQVRFISSGYAQVRVIPLERKVRIITAGTANVRVITYGRTEVNLRLSATAMMSSDCTTMTLTDSTGVYPTDPSGYNPEAAAYDPLRPKRTELNLYWAYRSYTLDEVMGSVGITTYNPTSQTPNLIPWQLSASLPAQGVYQAYLIGTPLSANYAFYVGDSLPETAAQADGWFVVPVPVLAGCAVIECVNKALDGQTNNILAGGCDTCYERKGLLMRGLASALADNDMTAAATLFDSLQTLCVEADCGC